MRWYSSLSEQKKDCDRRKDPAAQHNNIRYFSPVNVYNVVMCMQFILLFILILPKASSTLLLVYLYVTASILLRWRIQIPPRYMLLDCSIVCIASLLDPSIAFCISVYIFYFAWHNKVLYAALPTILSLYVLDNLFRILPVQALMLGMLLYYWNKEISVVYVENDLLRQKLYRMEQTELQLLLDYKNTERISQLKERQRLAEQLHDNLGHELTAAHLSIKAVGTLLDREENIKARIAQEKAEERLNSALQQLKKAVHRLEPEGNTDVDSINNLFKQSIYPVDYVQKGLLSDIQPYQIELLHTAVKEALTNISKHSVPNRVAACLEGTENIIKVSIENDGIKTDLQQRSGQGLRYMRKRVEAVQGSLSNSIIDNVFRIIIILPKNRS